MNVTADQLSAIMPNCPASRIARFLDPLNATMEAYEINTPARQAAFLAQIAHESGELRYTEELASGEAYEGRLDLGNNQPGDGRKFKGHGFGQLTGRKNTEAYAAYKGMAVSDVLGYLETDEGACDSAGWLWIIGLGLNLSKRAIAAGVEVGCNLNDLADRGAFELITWAFNGGLNGLVQRTAYFFRATADAYMIFSAIFHFLPWYSWLGMAIVLGLLTFLGLWPLVIAFLRKVPWQAWVALGVMILFWVWLDWHDTLLIAKTTKERNDYWEGQEKIAKEGFDKAVGVKRAEVAALKADQADLNKNWTTVYNFAMKQADARVAKALKEVSKYVTHAADAKCIVPVGFLCHASAAVDAANGRGDAANGQVNSKAVPEESLGLVDRASGIPLSAVYGWIQQLTGVGAKWRERALRCDAWVDEQAAAFEKPRPPP